MHPTGSLQGLVAWSPGGDVIAIVGSDDLALYTTTGGTEIHR